VATTEFGRGLLVNSSKQLSQQVQAPPQHTVSGGEVWLAHLALARHWGNS
jgi:hypothetical protein